MSKQVPQERKTVPRVLERSNVLPTSENGNSATRHELIMTDENNRLTISYIWKYVKNNRPKQQTSVSETLNQGLNKIMTCENRVAFASLGKYSDSVIYYQQSQGICDLACVNKGTRGVGI